MLPEANTIDLSPHAATPRSLVERSRRQSARTQVGPPRAVPTFRIGLKRRPGRGTDEAAAFFHAVYSAISEIPSGRVTSYGHIAALIGTPQRPRQVGVCLKHLPDDPSAQWNHDTVPWQRVVNARGVISPRNHPTAVRTQAELLRDEGVEVSRGGLGELSVDLSEYGWFPDVLPSEDNEGGVKEEEDDGDEEEAAGEEDDDDTREEQDVKVKKEEDDD
ncbi:hypothetical protein NLG97_g10462 [Lecanicillium saksenae]|uniref:Uncharacterized protein n=1 Tax=Lecanicillium saksenae TaxID=468837 RepID=A0ACC1QEZ1_9HYPO|nr:hypothetical protein NLG97_g10462 [Lecanicillium saksenae]